MLDRSRREWDALAQRLASEGIGALALDLRGHGESAAAPRRRQSQSTTPRWCCDVRAARRYLAQRSDVQQTRVGITGASLGANLAALAASADAIHRQPGAAVAVARLPRAAHRGGGAEDRPRPVLLVAGDDDPYASRSARELQKAGGGPRELLILRQAGHGTDDARRAIPTLAGCAGGLVSPDVAMILVPCLRNPSSSAWPACFSAFSSAGSSAASRRRSRAATTQPRPPPPRRSRRRRAPPLDESRAAALEATIAKNPSDAESRVQLGNLYFDAERFAEATEWYEEALKIDPKDVNASTDLGIAYYYMNQPDRALQQFDRSLAIDPKHAKTLLNIGIVRAFGKQDLEGRGESVAAGDRRRARRRRKRRRRGRRSTACGRRIPTHGRLVRAAAESARQVS